MRGLEEAEAVFWLGRAARAGSTGKSANAGPCPPLIWDARSGAPVPLPDFVRDRADLGEAMAFAISPRGDRMAAFSSVGAGELWDLPSLTPRKNYDHHQSAAGVVYAPVVAFSHDGGHFVTTVLIGGPPACLPRIRARRCLN